MKEGQKINEFGYMNMDMHEDLHDPKALSFVLNGVRQNTTKKEFGYVNEKGTKRCAKLPDGYKLRGYTHLAERDEFIVFLYNGTNSEIGGVVGCKYNKYINDADLPCKFNFGYDEWITIVPKRIQPCNDIVLYWSNGRTYKYFNIDDSKNYHLIKSCEDINLFKRNCAPSVELQAIDTGGAGILNGIYQVALQLTDEDGNVTNIFDVSPHVKITGGDNIAGGISDKYIEIKIKGFTSNYKHINVYLIKTIGGKTSVHLIYDKYPYVSGNLTLTYRSITDELVDVSLTEVYNKSDYWVNGKGLTQKDNRLILYDIDNHINLDYQRTAIEADVKFGVWRVRVEEAYKYPSMMGGEGYIPAIRWNYTDGTQSPDFPFINKRKVDGEVEDPCTGCMIPTWELKDTSLITWEADGYGDPYEESNASIKTYKNVTPKKEHYVLLDEQAEENKTQAKQDIEDTNKDLEDTFKDLDDTLTDAENSSCCDANMLNRETKANLSCFFKICPPGCICRDGCCYKLVSILKESFDIRDGNSNGGTQYEGPSDRIPTWGNEDYSGCGGLAEYVPDQVWELCDHKAPIDIIGFAPSMAIGKSCCGTPNNGICSGCRNCQNDLVSGRSSSGSIYETPPEIGWAINGLCSGGGRARGVPFEKEDDIVNPKIDTKVKVTSRLEVRGDPPQCNAEECNTGTVCPPGCKCNPDPNKDLQCDTVLCEHRGPCPPGCVCGVIDDTTSGIRHCIPKTGYTPGTCIPDPDWNDPDEPPVIDGGNGDSGIDEEPIYDEDGCTIIGYKPVKVLEGYFGYAESKETYPLTKDCNGEYLYGEYAGKPITIFRAPTRTKVPHFISYQTGVKSMIEPGNNELTKGYVQVIGIVVENIKVPTKLPKPLCENKPFDITWIKRDESNKTILAKALAMGTFEGEVYGEQYLFPKNGVNSIEYFNRYIRSSKRSGNPDSLNFEDHAGYNSQYAGYTLHSPDLTFKKSFIKGHKLRCELEIHGLGYRHGLYARGDEPSGPELVRFGGLKQILTRGATLNVPRMNQKGARSSIHLNKILRPVVEWDQRCIKDITYVDADSISKKSKRFDIALCNRDSEGCVYAQVDEFFILQKSADPYLSDESYNGDPEENIQKNNTSDLSFLGDVKFHDSVIYNASLHYVSIYRRHFRQYGRLEKARYVTTGVVGDINSLKTGKVQGIMGDVYISPYTFTKSTYVSNRVGRRTLVNDPITFNDAAEMVRNGPEGGEGKNGGKAQKGARGLKRVALNISGVALTWSMMLCGDAPISGLTVTVDPRNMAGLRHFNKFTKNDPSGLPDDVSYGGYWDGETKFDGYIPNEPNFRRCYYPGLQKTEIISYIESDVAVDLRQTGEEDLKEINYFNTKAYGLDSSLSNNQGWKNKYLNKFYMELQEVSLYQKIYMVLTILFFRIVFPLLLIVQLGKYIQGGGGIAGALISLIFQIILLLLVIAVMILLFIVLKTYASEYLLTMFGLKQCYNDIQGGPGDGLKRDFHDNYCKYNWDYSKQNEHNIGYGMPINYNVCDCVAEPSNKIIYSNPQIIDAPNDAWRNFKVNNNLSLGTQFGKITLIENVNNKLWAFTTDNIFDLRSGEVSLTTSEETVVLGRGDYINQAYPLWGGVYEGHAGLKYPNGAINTVHGLFYLDYESGKMYLFNGQIQEISTEGVSQFLLNNTWFYSNKNIIDQKKDEGMGYCFGYDHQYERLLFTKYDNEFSWTLSFDLKIKKWVSFHSYVPHLYMYDRKNIFTEKDGYIWQFNAGDKYQTYFDKYYPYVIEYPVVHNGILSAQHDFTALNTEANIYNGINPVRDLQKTFNKGFFFNTNQSTGMLNLLHNSEATNLVANMKEYSTAIRISKMGRNWRISDLKDFTANTNMSIYTLSPIYQRIPTDNLLTSPKHMYLSDRFINHQFILDDADNIELIAKNSLTQFKEPEV